MPRIDDRSRPADGGLLAAAEEHYRLLAENTSDVVARIGRDHRIIWISPNITTQWGYTSEQIVGTVLDDLMHPDDIAATRRSRDSAFESAAGPDRTTHELARLRTAWGDYRWMSGVVHLAITADGEPTLIIGMHDVDELVSAREVAERNAARLRATLDSLFDAHVILEAVRDDAGNIVDLVHVEANDTACRYNRMTREELIGARLGEISPPEVAGALLAMCGGVIESGEPLVLEDFAFADRSRMMEQRRFDVRAVKVGDAVSHTWRDVTERYERDRHLAHLATHDVLTELANRAALLDELSRALPTARRSGRSTALLMLDLDHFKVVNDTLGHSAGDALLRAAAGRLQQAVRVGDLVARLGGDEFVVVMRDVVSSDEVHHAAWRIVEQFRVPFEISGREFFATASVGVAVSDSLSSTDDLMREADVALYRAKERGRDMASLFHSDVLRPGSSPVPLQE